MKYSIVVPCYNEEKNLKKLVEEFENKLIKKKYNIELILVNNGSQDNSEDIMEKLKDEYDFIKIVNVKINKGYGFGILSGLKAASGEYLGWIHADLQFNPIEFSKGFDYLQDNNYPQNTFIKGIRTNRPVLDSFFTTCMGIYETIILRKKLWDINAQPTILSRDFYETWINPPYDFSLDLYAYYMAKKLKLNIYRYNVIQYERLEGTSSWNNGLKSRIKLIKRVINYSKKLKNGGKNEAKINKKNIFNS